MKKILVLSGIGILFLVIILSQFLINVQIDCRSQYGECPVEFINKFLSLNGKRIFAVRNGLKNIISSDHLVSSYSFQFKLPNTLHVELIVRKPQFALKNKNSDSYVLIDRNGQILESSENSALPYVTVNENLPKVGEVTSEKNLFALDLIQGIYQMYQIKNGEIQEDSLLVDLPGPVRVIFPLVGSDSDVLLGSLRLIYSNIQSEENKILYKEIDMRYKNPVLR